MRIRLCPVVVVALVMTTLFLSGCSGIRRLTAMGALRNGISSKFHIEDVQIFLHSDSDLTIRLADQRFGTAPAEAKAAQARQVAEFVRDNYREIKTVNSILIMLLTKTKVSTFREDIAIQGSYVFDRTAKLKRGPAKPNPPTPRDLLLYGEQAEDGTVRDGMRLFPSFGLNVSKNPIPATVGLDLAAFSDGPMFKNDHQFVLTADGTTLADGSATYQSSGTIADGQTAEFMTITISYAKFKELAKSQDATLIIGPKEIAFTDLQRSVFKAMVAEVEGATADGRHER